MEKNEYINELRKKIDDLSNWIAKGLFQAKAHGIDHDTSSQEWLTLLELYQRINRVDMFVDGNFETLQED